MTPTYYIDDQTVRDVRAWGAAVILSSIDIPAHERPDYFTPKGKWIKPAWLPASRCISAQN